MREGRTVPMTSRMISFGLKIVDVPKSMTLTLPSMSSTSRTRLSGLMSLPILDGGQPVDNVAGMAVGDGGQQLSHDLGGETFRKRAKGDDFVEELPSGTELGDQIEELRIVGELVQSHDVGMVLRVKEGPTSFLRISISLSRFSLAEHMLRLMIFMA